MEKHDLFEFIENRFEHCSPEVLKGNITIGILLSHIWNNDLTEGEKFENIIVVVKAKFHLVQFHTQYQFQTFIFKFWKKLFFLLQHRRSV